MPEDKDTKDTKLTDREEAVRRSRSGVQRRSADDFYIGKSSESLSVMQDKQSPHRKARQPQVPKQERQGKKETDTDK